MIHQAATRTVFFSLLFHVRREILFSMLYAIVIFTLYELHDLTFLSSFNILPVGLLSTVLSVFLAFRNNNAYARWWEARTLWGDLINASRFFGDQLCALLNPDNSALEPQAAALRHELVNRHLAFVNQMRMQLRKSPEDGTVTPYLSEVDRARLSLASNPASHLLVLQSETLRMAACAGMLDSIRLADITRTIGRFHDVLGGSERIRNTPFPREYETFIRIIVWTLILILPMYLLSLFSNDLSKSLIIPLTVGITFLIGVANKTGEILEAPFENTIHDIPLTSMCQTIERDLLFQLDETTRRTSKVSGEVIW